MSFKVAAEELSVTASAVSHQIKGFEAYLGCKLFHRGTRTIELTLEGQRLYAELQEPVTEIEAVVKRLRVSPDRIPLHIEMPAFFASELFLPQIPKFSLCNKHIDLRVQTTVPGDAHSPGTNMQILLSSERPNAICAAKLFPLHYQPACSPSEYANWGDKQPEDLQHATLIVHEARPNAWQDWFTNQQITAQAPQQTLTVDSMVGLARATQQGAGIALIPMPVSQQWFDNGLLKPLFDNHMTGTECYWLVSNAPFREESACQELWDWIVKQFTSSAKHTGEKS